MKMREGGTGDSRRVEQPVVHANPKETEGPGAEEGNAGQQAGRQHIIANGQNVAADWIHGDGFFGRERRLRKRTQSSP